MRSKKQARQEEIEWLSWAKEEYAEEALELLEDAIADNDPHIRRNAAQMLGDLPCEKSVTLLRQASQDRRERVRCEALLSLSQMGHLAKDALETFRRGLHDPAPRVKRTTLQALQRLGPLAAPLVKDITPLLFDRKHTICEQAAQTLGSLQSVKALPALFSCLDHYNGPRAQICKALGQINSPKAIQPLIKSLTQYGSQARPNVLHSLGLFGPRAHKAIPTLIDEYQKRHYAQYWPETTKALIQIGITAQQTHNIATLLFPYILTTPDAPYAETAPALLSLGYLKEDALILIKEHLQEHPQYSFYITKLLGYIGPQAFESVPTLTRYIRQHPHQLKPLALALGSIGSPQAEDALHTHLQQTKDPKEQSILLRALGMLETLSSQALMSIESFMDHAHLQLQIEAHIALYRHQAHTEPSLPLLLECIDSTLNQLNSQPNPHTLHHKIDTLRALHQALPNVANTWWPQATDEQIGEIKRRIRGRRQRLVYALELFNVYETPLLMQHIEVLHELMQTLQQVHDTNHFDEQIEQWQDAFEDILFGMD